MKSHACEGLLDDLQFDVAPGRSSTFLDLPGGWKGTIIIGAIIILTG